MFLDLALAWDPVRRRVDFAFDPAANTLALDATPVTPLLISLGSDGRAEPDDVLPDTVTEGSIANKLNPRRGWAGDALDPNGDRVGSKLWLLEREKQTDDVLRRAHDYAADALAWLGDREGVDIAVATSWPTRTAMLLDVGVGAVRQQLQVKR